MTQLFSADINSTIVNGDRQLYETLLKNIAENKDSKSEVNLQKTLLMQLLAKPKKIETNFKVQKLVVSQDAYRKSFISYLENLLKLKKLQQKIVANKAKIDTLFLQIHKQEKADETTQLFYAFYLRKQKEENLRVSIIEKRLLNIQNVLVNSLKSLSFDEVAITASLQKIDSSLEDLRGEIEQLKIKKERYVLLENKRAVESIEKKILKRSQQKQKLLIDKLGFLFLKFSVKVKKDADDLMSIHHTILVLLKQDVDDGWRIVKDIDNLLFIIEQKLLGRIETFKEQSIQELQVEAKNLWKVVDQPLFVINKTPISSFKLLLSLLIFIVGFFIGSLYKKYIAKLANKNKNISTGSHILLANMGYYTIFLITFFIVLKVLGIDLSSIALVAGALSVGIGFGLQNVISNFVSGIILMVERSVKIGDYIELDNNLRGHVVDIKMRSITVNTNSNIDIIVPNQDLIQNRVINWTMNDKIRRFEIPFGVAYGTEAQKVISLILEAVQKSGFQDIYNTPERYTRVIMTGMGNSSIDFELFVWIKGKEILFPKRTTSRFLILIYNTLNENGIEIPFPQQDLHIRSSDIALPIVMQKDEDS